MKNHAAFSVIVLLLLPLLGGCNQAINDGIEAYNIAFDTGVSLVGAGTLPTIDTSITMYSGDELAELPVPFWRDNTYIFRGWYDKPEDGTKIEAPYKPAASAALYAYWGNGATEDDDYKVTFNAGDGKFADGSTSLEKFIRRPPWTIIDMPVAVKDNGEVFGGWLYGGSNELTVTVPVPEISTAQRTMQCQWLPFGSSFNVTFSTYGGRWPDNTQNDITVAVEPDERGVITARGKFPSQPMLTGFVFTGWFVRVGTQTLPFSEGVFINKNLEVYPVWDIGADFTPPASVTFEVNASGTGVVGRDNNGVVYSTTITDGTTFSSLAGGQRVANFATSDVSRLHLHRMAGKYIPLQNWSMEMYVKLNSRGTNRQLVSFFTEAGSGQPGSFWIEDSSAENRLLFRAFPRGTEQLNAQNIIPVNPAAWMHIAFVKTGRQLICYRNGEEFINGGEQFSVFSSNAAFNDITTCRIGNVPNSQLYQFIMRNSAPALDASGDFANKAAIQAIVAGLNGN